MPVGSDLSVSAVRKRKGLCPLCGNRTHKLTLFGTKPINNDTVKDGVCLFCHPKMAHRSGPAMTRSSRMSAEFALSQSAENVLGSEAVVDESVNDMAKLESRLARGEISDGAFEGPMEATIVVESECAELDAPEPNFFEWSLFLQAVVSQEKSRRADVVAMDRIDCVTAELHPRWATLKTDDKISELSLENDVFKTNVRVKMAQGFDKLAVKLYITSGRQTQVVTHDLSFDTAKMATWHTVRLPAKGTVAEWISPSTSSVPATDLSGTAPIADVSGPIETTILVGNTCTQLDNVDHNQFEWSLFVQAVRVHPDAATSDDGRRKPADTDLAATARIDSVVAELHPTFKSSYVELLLDGNVFTSCKFRGWGTFTVKVTIRSGAAREKIEHELSFERPETVTYHAMSLPSRVSVQKEFVPSLPASAIEAKTQPETNVESSVDLTGLSCIARYTITPKIPWPSVKGKSFNLIFDLGSVVNFHFSSNPAKSAIVNSTDEGFVTDGGVNGAVVDAGGSRLFHDREILPVLNHSGSVEVRCSTGNAVMTGPSSYGTLQVGYIIHAVGPNYCIDDDDILLSSAYTESLNRAKEEKLEAVAFSLISAGFFRGNRSLKQVVGIGVEAICNFKSYNELREVHICAFDPNEVAVFREMVADISTHNELVQRAVNFRSRTEIGDGVSGRHARGHSVSWYLGTGVTLAEDNEDTFTSRKNAQAQARDKNEKSEQRKSISPQPVFQRDAATGISGTRSKDITPHTQPASQESIEPLPAVLALWAHMTDTLQRALYGALSEHGVVSTRKAVAAIRGVDDEVSLFLANLDQIAPGAQKVPHSQDSQPKDPPQMLNSFRCSFCIEKCAKSFLDENEGTKFLVKIDPKAFFVRLVRVGTDEFFTRWHEAGLSEAVVSAHLFGAAVDGLHNSNNENVSAPPEKMTDNAANGDTTSAGAIVEGREVMRGLLNKSDAAPLPVPLEYLEQCTNQFSDDQRLGEGAFSKVYMAKDRLLRHKFAVKRLQVKLVANVEIKVARKTFERELATLKHFRHPNIARLYAYYLSPDLDGEQALVFELAANGSLHNYLSNAELREKLHWTTRISICHDIAKALEYMHSGLAGQVCYHRDVKSSNICLKRNFTAMLIDCGVSKMIPENESNTTMTIMNTTGLAVQGTPGYICPTYARKLKMFTSANEVFPLGIVFVEIFTGVLQNSILNGKEIDLFDLYSADGAEDRELEKDADGSAGDWNKLARKEVASLAVQCISLHARMRPEIKSIVQRLGKLVSHTKPWSPGERNSITVLNSAPLVWRDVCGQVHPISESLDFALERGLLVQCMTEAGRDIKLSFDVATDDRLQVASMKRCGCLHFSGHGHPSALVFEDGQGGAHFLNEHELCDHVHAQPFKFVFVSACYSENMGRALVKAGVPHVVCCKHNMEIRDDASLKFTHTFYYALAEGYTIAAAFDMGQLVVSKRFDRGEVDKFLLLPEDGDHSIPIFDAEKLEWKDEQRNDISIPAPPELFIGREMDMYALLHKILSRRFVTLVGKEGIGCSSCAAAVCHYIKNRKTTILNIETIYFLRNGGTGHINADPIQRFFIPLHKQLVLEGKACALQHEDGDGLSTGIVEALGGTKSLIVFDGLDVGEVMTKFLDLLFEKTNNVRVLITGHEPAGLNFSSKGLKSSFVQENVLYLDPLSFESTVKLFGQACPHCDAGDLITKLAPLHNNLAIFKKLGEGVPAKIIHRAKTITKEDYENLT